MVNWYLKEIESEIETEAELIRRKMLVEKVIERLIHHVSSDTYCCNVNILKLLFSPIFFLLISYYKFTFVKFILVFKFSYFFVNIYILI